MAIRAALGASPRRLVRQLLTESLALGIAAALGLLLASWLVRLLLAILPRGVPRVGEITLDPFVAGDHAVDVARDGDPVRSASRHSGLASRCGRSAEAGQRPRRRHARRVAPCSSWRKSRSRSSSSSVRGS